MSETEPADEDRDVAHDEDQTGQEVGPHERVLAHVLRKGGVVGLGALVLGVRGEMQKVYPANEATDVRKQTLWGTVWGKILSALRSRGIL